MAAFQFSVQQVSFPSEELSLHSSLDSLSSVIDPNVDFVSTSESIVDEENGNSVLEEKKSVLKTKQKSPAMEKVENLSFDSENNPEPVNPSEKAISTSQVIPSSYPNIPVAVAHYINRNNPEIREEAEKYFKSEAFHSKNSSSVFHSGMNNTPPSPLHSLSITSEALALQHSVIGNYGVTPVSADIVAQVVADTKLRLEQGSLKSQTSSTIYDANSEFSSIRSDSMVNSSLGVSKSELIRYPPDIISSTVERHSWFSSSSTDTEHISNAHKSDKHRHGELQSRSSSQSSINSVGLRKTRRSKEDFPKVHSSGRGNSRQSKSALNGNNYDLPCEQYAESSVEYETDTSLSEKFDMESMCSEAFETESNFSEFSAIDEEMLNGKKSFDFSKPGMNSSLKDIVVSSQNGSNEADFEKSPIKVPSSMHTKSTETDDSGAFKLLREKAALEGRLESVIQGQNDLVQERDKFASLATTYEAKLKLLQSQLDASMSEKKNALMMFDVKAKEEKNWDNVIKEYQNIIEAKNAEIKGVKEDLSASEQAHTQTRITLEEMKVDVDQRDAAIAGLKKKIAELHVEVQILLQGKTQMENEVKNVRLEMDTLQKSKEWFQEQLHSTQENRNKLHQQLISTQSSQSVTSNSLDKMVAEKNQLKLELAHLQQRAVAEKEVLMKRLETIEADMKEREALFDDIQKDKGSAEVVLVERIRKLEDEKVQLMNDSFNASSQEHELNALRSDCEEKTKLIQTLAKEKAELNKHVAVLQKSTNDKDLSVQQLLQQVKDLGVKMEHSEKGMRRAEDLISKLKEERTAADVALASANEEKRVIEENLKLVSDALNKLSSNIKHMKMEGVTQASKLEQLTKEKKALEDAVLKGEESMQMLRKEIEQNSVTENQSRNVLVDDLKKKKTDVENVLHVYTKDLLNYQHTIQNLNKQKVEMVNDISNLKVLLSDKEKRVAELSDENASVKEKLSELVNLQNKGATVNSDVDAVLPAEENSPTSQNKRIVVSKKNLVYSKLKEKIKECEALREKLKTQEKEKSADWICSGACQSQSVFSEDDRNKLLELETLLKQKQDILDEKFTQLKKNEEVIIELEKEKGKAIGFAEQCNVLKQRMTELEAKLTEKDAQTVQYSCLMEDLKQQLKDLSESSKNQISGLETDLNKERAVVKNLRQQVFHEKRANSHLQRDLSNLKSGLEQANQISDAKIQEIQFLQAELALKVQAELKHRAEIEHFQTEIHLQHNIVEKLNKELEEVKARDPALAEQIKALSWRLKEKSNEILALQQKMDVMEESHKGEVDRLKKNMQETEILLEKIKKELDDTRKEKFNYQSKVIELRKALKSKLAELESKGILRIENKSSANGPVIHLNIPDPEVTFDESYVNDLLQKSMHLSDTRPLNNLQECLNSLKEEMAQLQKKIIDSSESSQESN